MKAHIIIKIRYILIGCMMHTLVANELIHNVEHKINNLFEWLFEKKSISSDVPTSQKSFIHLKMVTDILEAHSGNEKAIATRLIAEVNESYNKIFKVIYNPTRSVELTSWCMDMIESLSNDVIKEYPGAYMSTMISLQQKLSSEYKVMTDAEFSQGSKGNYKSLQEANYNFDTIVLDSLKSDKNPLVKKISLWQRARLKISNILLFNKGSLTENVQSLLDLKIKSIREQNEIATLDPAQMIENLQLFFNKIGNMIAQDRLARGGDATSQLFKKEMEDLAPILRENIETLQDLTGITEGEMLKDVLSQMSNRAVRRIFMTNYSSEELKIDTGGSVLPKDPYEAGGKNQGILQDINNQIKNSKNNNPLKNKPGQGGDRTTVTKKDDKRPQNNTILQRIWNKFGWKVPVKNHRMISVQEEDPEPIPELE